MSCTNNTLRVVDIIEGTTVDGPGFRTSIYLAGCHHHCPGCHNPSTWPDDAGHDMTFEEIIAIINYNDFDVTFSGGDPMYQAQQLLPLMQLLKSTGRNIWCYTGFTLEEITSDEAMSSLLPYIDVLVDGPYIASLNKPGLIFRGSENQRLIDVSATLSTGSNTEWKRKD